jgi:PAS domain S-box-containing protein
MSDSRGTAGLFNGSSPGAGRERRDPAGALKDTGIRAPRVLLVGLEELDDDCWTVLADAAVRLERADDVAGALRALTARPIPVVIAGTPSAEALMPALRRRPELASTHVVVAAALDVPDELRAALDTGADDVMRVPFEPEVLVARVAAGLRAARLRSNEALLRSLVDNIPGALYRGACDRDWTMYWLSDEVETITGYPASDFVDNSVRTFASVIHPDDRDYVERSVAQAVDARRPFNLEYRILRRDGDVRWVLERGQAQDGGDGRRRLHGAIFDITFAAPPSRPFASERLSRRSSPRFAPHALVSSTPPTGLAGRSSATSMTAPSSGSYRPRSNSRCGARPTTNCPSRPGRNSTKSSPSCVRASPSCANSPTGCIRLC